MRFRVQTITYYNVIHTEGYCRHDVAQDFVSSGASSAQTAATAQTEASRMAAGNKATFAALGQKSKTYLCDSDILIVVRTSSRPLAVSGAALGTWWPRHWISVMTTCMVESARRRRARGHSPAKLDVSPPHTDSLFEPQRVIR